MYRVLWYRARSHRTLKSIKRRKKIHISHWTVIIKNVDISSFNEWWVQATPSANRLYMHTTIVCSSLLFCMDLPRWYKEHIVQFLREGWEKMARVFLQEVVISYREWEAGELGHLLRSCLHHLWTTVAHCRTKIATTHSLPPLMAYARIPMHKPLHCIT